MKLGLSSRACVDVQRDFFVHVATMGLKQLMRVLLSVQASHGVLLSVPNSR